jgi:energy-coupling factor transport system ATP-binding protein
MAYVELENVFFSYPNGHPALEGVTLSIDAGESVAIVGQNGAGKSTLVKLINGLTKPTSGRVLIDGVDTRSRTAAQTARHVGFVFQNPDEQIFNSTIRKEIAFALKRLKLDENEIEHRVEEAARLTGLASKLGANPYDLPLSVRKFVTMAAVIAADAEVMIFDEPTAGQDLAGLNRISRVIRALQKRGKALITITHDMEFVAKSFERTIVMANREMLLDGPTDSIFYDRPAMRRARLKQPALVQLADRFADSSVGLDVDLLNKRLRART